MKMTAGRRALDKIHKRRDRYEIPDWQRSDVWNEGRKQELIDSILRGWKLPKFYFLKTGVDQYEVVDGQQRLNAILEFFDGDLALDSQSAKRIGGAVYDELPSEVSDAFDDFEIEFDEIENANDDELKSFFQRLQQGLPLTASERLNAVHSKLRDFCRRTARHRFFENKVVFPDTRYAHFDVVSKATAIELEGIETGLRFDNLRDLFSDHSAFSGTSAAAKRLRQALDFLDRAFPDRSPLLKNRTIVQSLISLASRLVATGRSEGLEKRFAKFVGAFTSELGRQVELGAVATDTDYVRFQRSVNANVRAGAKTRQEILLRKLFTLDPKVADAFDSATVAESGVAGRVDELGQEVRSLVEKINLANASSTGDDFFKATSKTAQALVRIGKPARTLEAYQRLIDDLYFLFREGPGQRLKDNWPESLADVNTLRTELRHDVDHGEGSKSRKKRRKAGRVFEKYAGAVSPQSADPTRFPLVHANLLTAIDRDLRILLGSLEGPRSVDRTGH